MRDVVFPFCGPGIPRRMTDEPRVEEGRASPTETEPSRPPGPTEEAVTRGRSSGTPFVMLGGVALVIWTVVALVAGALLLLWWLG